ncbi:MAG TPA: c-type cytochrome [Bryobacteraceae bacterium]|nr:c-type cytochrome [Bryobacteraceae bacterium]
MKLLVVAILSTGLVAQVPDLRNSPGNAEKGKQIFIKDGCYSCHGYDGHGGVAPKLAPRPIPAVAFIAIVRHPPASAMPTYSPKVMSDAELTDVWAYLKSIPDPPPVKNTPLLNQ